MLTHSLALAKHTKQWEWTFPLPLLNLKINTQVSNGSLVISITDSPQLHSSFSMQHYSPTKLGFGEIEIQMHWLGPSSNFFQLVSCSWVGSNFHDLKILLGYSVLMDYPGMVTYKDGWHLAATWLCYGTCSHIVAQSPQGSHSLLHLHTFVCTSLLTWSLTTAIVILSQGSLSPRPPHSHYPFQL